MRCVRFHEHGGPAVLRVEEQPTPDPLPSQVVIRVAASGVNYADVLRRNGRYAEPTTLPHAVGAEVAGTVVSRGSEAKELDLGARVAGFVWSGGYAEYAVADSESIVPLPPTLSFDRGAAFPLNGIVAYHLLATCGAVTEGCSVLITAAAGGVGTFAVQLAKMLGARPIIAAASTDAKLQVARDQGATAGVLYNENENDWVERVIALTGGRGVDVVLEGAGGELGERAMMTLAPLGRFVVFGGSNGVRHSISRDHLKSLNAMAIGFNFRRLLRHDPEKAMKPMPRLASLVEEGVLNPIITHRLPLHRAAYAHEIMEGRLTTGKLLLRPSA